MQRLLCISCHCMCVLVCCCAVLLCALSLCSRCAEQYTALLAADQQHEWSDTNGHRDRECIWGNGGTVQGGSGDHSSHACEYTCLNCHTLHQCRRQQQQCHSDSLLTSQHTGGSQVKNAAGSATADSSSCAVCTVLSQCSALLQLFACYSSWPVLFTCYQRIAQQQQLTDSTTALQSLSLNDMPGSRTHSIQAISNIPCMSLSHCQQHTFSATALSCSMSGVLELLLQHASVLLHTQCMQSHPSSTTRYTTTMHTLCARLFVRSHSK